ncbi:MAG: BatD family protein [Arcobacteraceae bacterium]
MTASIANAAVVLQSPERFYKGDVVNFTIIASGKEIKIPEITDIDGVPVQKTRTSQHTTIRNGERSFQLIQGYALVGTKDINIPSFEIIIDNKIEKTKAKTIKMLEVTKTKSDLYDLSIAVDKKEVFVGEAVEFTLRFQYKKDLQIVNLDLKKPAFENFWVKELQTQKQQNIDPIYEIQEIKYLLFPQKSGKIDLSSVRIDVTTMKNSSAGSFYLSTPTETTPVYSNSIELNLKALPNSINLIGDFNISSTVDKLSVMQGKAVSYKLSIEGRGNLDDLDEVILDIPNTTIYDNPSQKEYNIQNNLYGGKYTKAYSIVGQDDFTIPAIEIRYFDKKTSEVKTIRTKSYDIRVNGQVVEKKTLEVSSVDTQEKIANVPTKELIKTPLVEKILYFILGVLFTIIVMGLFWYLKKRVNKEDESVLYKRLKKAKTSDELFKMLVVYINIDEKLDKIIYKLENLSMQEYKNEKIALLKTLKKLLEKDLKLEI